MEKEKQEKSLLSAQEEGLKYAHINHKNRIIVTPEAQIQLSE